MSFHSPITPTGRACTTAHFRKRFAERVDRAGDPLAVATLLRDALDGLRFDLVQYLGRQDKEGLRRVLFCYGGCYFVAVFRTEADAWTFITVHKPGVKA